MANYNLTNQEIKDTFQQLAQVSGSGLPDNKNYILDGTGSLKTSLELTASLAISASHAVIADSSLSATNADTASFFGEGIVTASALASTITFTKDNGTTFDVTVAQSGSVESSSYASFASNAESASYATSASSALYSVSGSSSLYAVSSSHALYSVSSSAALYSVSASAAIRAVSSSHALEADHATQADDLVINVKNLAGETLAKGTAVHATGVTGENVTIIKADASIAGNMPAVAVLNEELTDNSTGEALINGRLIGIDTSNLVAGAPVYVNIEGNLTATKPTGSLLIQNIGTAAKINASDGEIILQGSGRSNDLPNITTDYLWKGDSNGVPQAVAESTLDVNSASTATSASHAVQADNATSASYAVTSSHVTDPNIAYTNVNNSFTGTQTFNNIAVNGTGSFAYLESVTGSAKIIGDAFIILNNDTPTERYAGIKVIDSGAADTTASLQFDGGTNDWFYEYGGDDATDHGVLMFGPEYATKGSPTYLTSNTIPKGDGGHHLNDSNIIDDGSLITLDSAVSASGNISGSRIAAADGFATNAASSFAFIQTDSQTAYGNVTIDMANSVFSGLTIGAAALPTRAPGITMYTSHSSFATGFNYAGITINDGDNGVTFYGNKVNAGGSGAVAPADKAAFVIQAGATADSTTGDNTSFAINNADGFPNFTKTTIFRRPVSASAGISASGDIGLSGNLIVDGASNLNGVSTLSGSVIVTGSVQSEVISGSADGSRNFSLDMEKASMYTCELISGSNVNIQPANIKKGATVMLKTIQPSTSADSYGVLTYESSVKFSGGTSLQPTAASGSVDVFTFVSFDGTTLDATSVTDLK